ncbi:hypothetical protein GIB67_001503 [Kingdonia uniflora]|uniref:Aminotransferase-like plant mobile domain-containing protein n=1 Tax=Kingdonia uniflora TaxID=39325 RepID=A0A7J7MNU7_9MAGN|nr:hypothetical protein GIB67_001503 [Kingdonia uniflora]
MHMPEGDPHPSTLPGFRGTRDPERSVTRSRGPEGRKSGWNLKMFNPNLYQTQPKKTSRRGVLPNFQTASVTSITRERNSRRHIHYGVQSIKGYCHNSSCKGRGVNIFGQFMEIRLGYSNNRLIQALTERWWPNTYAFLFPCAEIGVTPLNFTMQTSLSIGQYSTQVPYDDTWPILSNARQLLPNINSSHIKSGNVSIAHLRKYLTVAADREDDITIARIFILFMMGHLWFQTANDAVPPGYLTAVNDLDLAVQYGWGSAILASLYRDFDTAVTTGGAITEFVQLLLFYEYYGIGHPIVKEEVKYPAYPRLRAWERGNKRKTNVQVANLFIIDKYHTDHRTVETIIWEPWFDSAVSETEDVLNAKLLSRKSMSPHISPAALHEMRQAGFVDCEQFVVGEERETCASYWAKQTSEVGHMLIDSQRMGNQDLFGPTVLRAGITPVVVTSA